jgi:aminoglycoside phosphotransferase (APT) family kinase protein
MIEDRIIAGDARPAFPTRTGALLAQRHTLIDPDVVVRAARTYLQWIPDSVRHGSDGKGSCIYIITGDDDRGAVLKAGVFLDHPSPIHETLFAHLVRSHARSVPVQRMLVLDCSGDIIPSPYFIREWIPGQSILAHAENNPSADLDPLFEQIGESLRTIHDIEYPLSGRGLPSDDTVRSFVQSQSVPESLSGSAVTFEERFSNPVIDAAHTLVNRAVMSVSLSEDIVSVLHNEPPDTEPLIIRHGDCSMGNFIGDTATLTGIIDGSATIGYRYEELAESRMFLSSLAFHVPSLSAESSFHAMCRGYGEDPRRVLRDDAFRYFLIARLVQHIEVLTRMGRVSHINDYLELLQSTLRNVH